MSGGVKLHYYYVTHQESESRMVMDWIMHENMWLRIQGLWSGSSGFLMSNPPSQRFLALRIAENVPLN